VGDSSSAAECRFSCPLAAQGTREGRRKGQGISPLYPTPHLGTPLVCPWHTPLSQIESGFCCSPLPVHSSVVDAQERIQIPSTNDMTPRYTPQGPWRTPLVRPSHIAGCARPHHFLPLPVDSSVVGPQGRVSRIPSTKDMTAGWGLHTLRQLGSGDTFERIPPESQT